MVDENDATVATFNKSKTLGAVSGIHNLTPPNIQPAEEEQKVAIIESLKVEPRLQDLFLEIQGLEYDPKKREIVQVARPIMNKDGAYRLVKIIKTIAQEVEYSNFHETEINQHIFHLYKENWPSFTLWNDEYELDPRDFNYVSSVLLTFISSSFHKARNGKYVNAVARIYSEDFLGKVMANQGQQKKEGTSMLGAFNPFKPKK